jgi:exopolysaccharide biosynthesis WecB/TagA/CpsF family protein
MKDLAKIITTVDTPEQATEKVDVLLESSGLKSIAFVNAHACVMSNSNKEFYDALKNVELVFRDGIGAKWLLQYYKILPGYNANGTDLIPLILQKHKNKNIVCIGTSEPYLSKSVASLRSRGINITAFLDGFHDFNFIETFLKKNKPDIVVLGMGMPKQELFVQHLKNSTFEIPVTLICGGAILDFYAERFNRAPTYIRKVGLEWLFRLVKEPKRLFNRYVIGIPIFLYLLITKK